MKQLLIFTFLLSQILVGQFNLNSTIPTDKKVIINKLDNGIAYYIKENNRPENRAFLRLAVKAGAVLETENQNGLAHFCEHMAFNGTENYKKHEIINYLESIGMKFGPEINAYTTQNETVYMLEIPIDSLNHIDKGLKILKEWATNISFDPEEIEKERGVIIEEWRSRRGAKTRISELHNQVILKGSKYAKHNVIGDKKILANFDHHELIDFYNKWYTPNLMAVIAVGDFNKNYIDSLIQVNFSKIKKSNKPSKLPEYEVPNHKGTRFSIVTDKEALTSEINVIYKKEINEIETQQDLLDNITTQIYTMMLNTRFYEILQNANPPYLNAYAYPGDLTKTKDAFFVYTSVKNNGFLKGFKTVMSEIRRAELHGFTNTEFDRAKKSLLRSMEVQFNERKKLNSSNLANQYSYHFLSGNPIPSVEFKYNFINTFIDSISLNEINNLTKTFISNNNRVITFSSPENDSLIIPTEEDFVDILNTIDAEEISNYEDNTSNEKLFNTKLPETKIISNEFIDTSGVTKLKLKNGIKVLLKPTDFKNDEILMSAFSPGGHSLINKENYISGIAASSIISSSGLGNFDYMSLRKKLTGIYAYASPWISELYEGFSGTSTQDDLETMFQLINLYFTQPREDSTAYLSFVNKINNQLENKTLDPSWAYYDTLRTTLNSYHYSTEPWSQERLSQINLDTSFAFYKERFADASDFTFVFAGNFEIDNIIPLISKYLGNLPITQRTESFRDIGVRYPKGRIIKEVKKGIESKSLVSFNFTGECEYDKYEAYLFSSMLNYLKIKLREVIREEQSGTYGVRVAGGISREPFVDYRLSISFGCDPQRVEELSKIIETQIDSLINYPPNNSYITKIQNQQIQSYRKSLKENRFWLNILTSLEKQNLPHKKIFQYEDKVNSLTSDKISNVAKKYINKKNMVKVILYPENIGAD